MNYRIKTGSALCTDLQVQADLSYQEILVEANKTHEQLLEEARKYVSERFAGLNPHENPSERSEDLEDTSERREEATRDAA